MIVGSTRYGRLRYAQDYRDTPESLGAILVESVSGLVPLKEVASIRFVNGAPMIRTEAGQSTGFCFCRPQRNAYIRIC
jgi:Cu(I)/Ag(I) efflux system membrane protein CusA/SilA